MLNVWELAISEAGVGAKLSTVTSLHVMSQRLTKKAYTCACVSAHTHNSLKVKDKVKLPAT